ncbi:hypothetical protein HYPSUDRAFT_929959 [Hypholoma sublateritium FD-334 SS-4]|uniref:Blue (type 1) copper domain-containing protein n=1 Tax=Hypholoma sublateritium (strain FD-334 SS-4) TaxID=945553 RepID=A0A0D2MTL6_HYPSF|nr:hypothetical protein HYPSUDRAFT_929959 [Hypholoma sublateritium FD-334 SS-4]
MFAKLAVFLLPAFVAGQAYGPPPGPAAPSTTSAAAAVIPSAPANSGNQININVGAGGAFIYSPANISAPVGSLVTFYFPGDIPHSVSQSTFANPCTYLAADPNNASAPVGFDSGLVTASTFTINVTDENPIWFHCRQLTHCGSGMVGSINAPLNGTNTYANFLAAAVALGGNAPNVSLG